jgi:hypothetical protein
MIDIVAAFKAFLKPWEGMKNLKGSLVDGLIYNEIGAVILAVITFLFGNLLMPPSKMVVGITSFALLILVPIGLLITSLIYYVIAKLLGGKGSFDKQTFLFGAVSLPASIFAIIPIINILAALWSLVVYFFILKETHKLSDLKTIVVEFLPAIIIAIIGAFITATMLPPTHPWV